MNAYYVSHSELSTEEIAVNEKYNLCPHRIYSLKENKSINEKKKKVQAVLRETRYLECYNLT